MKVKGVAGYSGTPLPKKLGITEGSRVALIGAPKGFAETLELPPGARLLAQARAPMDVIVWFVTRRSELQRRVKHLASLLEPSGGLWVAWPKKASGVCTDLTFEPVQAAGLDVGLVDNKVCAIDEIWSGLRFVFRVVDRPEKTRAARV